MRKTRQHQKKCPFPLAPPPHTAGSGSAEALAQTVLGDLETKVAILQEDIAQSWVRLNKWRVSLDTLHQDLKQREAVLEQRDQELIRRSAEFDERRQALDGRASELQAWQAQMEAIVAEVQKTREAIAEQEKTWREKQAQLAAYEEQIQKKTTECEKQKAELDATQASLEEARKGVDEREAGLAQRQADLDAQQQSVLTSQQNLEQFRRTLEETRCRLVEAEATIEKDRQSLSAERQTMESEHACLAQMEAELHAREQEVARRSKELDEADARFAHQQAAADRFRESLQEAMQAFHLTSGSSSPPAPPTQDSAPVAAAASDEQGDDVPAVSPSPVGLAETAEPAHEEHSAPSEGPAQQVTPAQSLINTALQTEQTGEPTAAVDHRLLQPEPASPGHRPGRVASVDLDPAVARKLRVFRRLGTGETDEQLVAKIVAEHDGRSSRLPQNDKRRWWGKGKRKSG